MMVDNEDLGLSLSLSCSKIDSNHTTGNGNNRLQLNLMAPSLFGSSSSSSSSSSSLALATLQKNRWLESFPNSSVDRIAEPTCRALVVSDPMSFLRGIDVNRAPASAGDDDEPGASSPNSTISSVSGKRSEREIVVVGDDLDGDRGCTDEEDGDTSRKKLRLSKDQSAVLEESFKEHNTLNPKQKMALAKRLGLRPRQVEVWFQNRRARTKLKQTEVDCEFLKRCCEQLTDDNRRLQKEVQELRALKLSPQFYMQMTPPTTLTMCPSCERVGVPPSSGSAAPTRFPVNPFRSYEGLRTRP